MNLSAAGRTRLVVAGLASAGLIASAVTAIAPASAATTSLKLLASQTSATPSLSADGHTLTLSVRVNPTGIGDGLLITPQGTVTFSDDNGDNLGSATLPSCLLTKCIVTKTIQTADISDYTSEIIASYSGDLLLKPSSSAVPFEIEPCSNDEDSQPCDVQVSNSNTSTIVSSNSSGGSVEGMLGGAALPCSIGGAAVATANGFGLDADSHKFLVYSADETPGAAYRALNDSLGEGTEWLCYASPTEFTAYSDNGSTTFPKTTASFNQLGNAPQLTSGAYAGEYVGLLAFCEDLDSLDTSPCITNYEWGIDEEGGTGTYVIYEITAPPGDPHYGG